MQPLYQTKLSAQDSIDALQLNIRVQRSLIRSGIKTIEDLTNAIDMGKIQTIHGLGDKGLDEISIRLSQVTVSRPNIVTERSSSENTISPSIPVTEPKFMSLNQVLDLQKKIIAKYISIGLLHQDAIISGKSIRQWIEIGEISGSNHEQIVRVFGLVLEESFNLSEELCLIFEGMSPNHINILIGRYGYAKKTLEIIGKENGVTRERVRQIGVKLERDMDMIIRLLPNFLRIQSALLIAGDMGSDITFNKWKDVIISSGLLGRQKIRLDVSIDPFEATYAICNLVSDTIQELVIPDNLLNAIQLALAGQSNAPARITQIRQKLPKEMRKIILRHSKFSGAIDAKWLSQETKTDFVKMQEIVQALGFVPIQDNWYAQPNERINDDISHHHVFHQALRKMFQYCGPLPIEEACSAIRHAVSRTSYPTPPPPVMREILLLNGYKLEDNLFFWEGKFDAKLPSSETLILECVRKKGGVVHHAELAQTFLDNGLSFPSLHATLRRSTLFQRIETGLYKLRGSTITSQDIARAESAGEWTSVNPEVSYKRSGHIEVQATLGILAIATGVILSKQLPNLSGEWQCHIGNQEFRTLTAIESEFRGLGKAFKALGCQVGDRVKFTFDTFSRAVSVEKTGV